MLKEYASSVGSTPRTRHLADQINHCVRSNSPVIIVGEDGTGKESLAREIHSRGRREGGAFVPIPIGTLDPDAMAEVLFGSANHLPTGKIRNGRGRIVDALGGTLFLDRISAADECIQFVLPKAIEAANGRAFGSDGSREARIRLIAALNPNSLEVTPSRRMQLDLLILRIGAVILELPPLRQRREDIPLLVDHFVLHAREHFGLDVSGIDDDALRALVAYSWPGNVRELKNVVIQGAAYADGLPIGLAELPERISNQDVVSDRHPRL